MKRFFTTATLLIASLFAGASPASSATVVLTGIGLGEYPVPLLTDHGTGLAPEDAYLVQILVTVNGTQAIAFCVDLFTPIGLETYNAVFGSPADYTNGLRAAWILETYGPAVAANVDAAALQLALWDVVHDNGDGLSAGRVQLAPAGSTALRGATEAIVTASGGQSSTNATILYTTSLGGTPAQTLIASGAFTDVPEPATWALMAAGAAFCLVLRRGARGVPIRR